MRHDEYITYFSKNRRIYILKIQKEVKVHQRQEEKLNILIMLKSRLIVLVKYLQYMEVHIKKKIKPSF